MNFYLLIKPDSMSVADYNGIVNLNQKMYACTYTEYIYTAIQWKEQYWHLYTFYILSVPLRRDDMTGAMFFQNVRDRSRII